MSKAMYASVNGTAQKITKVYAPVNGVAHSVKKVYKGVDGIARLVFEMLEPTFSKNTWADVIKACQAGIVPDSWAVGDQMPLTINGVTYAVDIIGKNHDNYADGSGKAPLTFQLHDCYGTKYKMDNTGYNRYGWDSCDMRRDHLPEIFDLLPSEVKTAIREVNKLTSEGSRSDTIETAVDKLFLLSEIEVWGEALYTAPGEGTQYAYYANGGSKVKRVSGETSYWWLRSPYIESSEKYALINSAGARNHNGTATAIQGVSFAFCF